MVRVGLFAAKTGLHEVRGGEIAGELLVVQT